LKLRDDELLDWLCFDDEDRDGAADLLV